MRTTTKTKDIKKKITLTLKDNGTHSLEKGLSAFKKFEQNEDEFLLKEAIMFMHHGIELLMKQVLVENGGEFLIFSDLNHETVKKVIKAKKENQSVFYLTKPIHTATYDQVLDRVEAFVNIYTLPENLKNWLIDFNSLRNQIEHYAIDKEIEIIKNLIASIRKPLLNFFEGTIKGFKNSESKKVNEEWGEISDQIQVEKEIINKYGKEKLIIVCEGESDKQVLEVIINKVINQYNLSITYSIIVTNSIPYFSKTLRNIMSHSVSSKIIVIIDGDGTEDKRKEQLDNIGVPSENQIIIKPQIEVWLSSEFDKTIKIRDIKRNKLYYNNLAENVNIESLAKRNESFNKLINILKNSM